MKRRRHWYAPDFNQPWREQEYCAIDIETTGLDLRNDDILSVGTVIIRDGRAIASSARYWELKPSCAVSISALMVHGLRADDLEDAFSLSGIADELRAQLAGRIMVAHGAWIEQAFLSRALELNHRHLVSSTVDTAAVARAEGLVATNPGYEPNLEDLASSIGLVPHSPHHALGDALTTSEVFLVLAQRVASRHDNTVSARDLVRLSREHRCA